MSILYNCQEGACVKLIRARLLTPDSYQLLNRCFQSPYISREDGTSRHVVADMACPDRLLSGQVKAKAVSVAEIQPGATILR